MWWGRQAEGRNHAWGCSIDKVVIVNRDNGSQMPLAQCVQGHKRGYL
jgi:hypothetical protein